MMIKSRRNVWIMVTSVISACILVVFLLLPFLYPPEEILFQMVVTVLLSLALGVPILGFLGMKILEAHELSMELQRLVDRDRLTDVATRDCFFRRMEAAPRACGVSLMIDIDHFKTVNDTHGHLAGDRVIREVARILSANVRALDMVCRFGGEEFVAFLHEVDAEEAQRVAERIRTSVAGHRIDIGDATTLSVTVSIGIAGKLPQSDISTSLHDADEALYRAKSDGRNRVVSNLEHYAVCEMVVAG